MTADAELRNVTKVFAGHATAVDDVSFVVEKGEFFSMLGPSGCGKTTTLRMIAGLEVPTRGEVYVRGEPMGRRPAHRRPTNTIFQRPALFPHLTVAENIGFGLTLERIRGAELRRRVQEALALVELTGFDRRRPHQLSGGQQQRVAIARALVKEPTVLLLDEPLSSLDLRLRVQMQRVLKRIQEGSKTTFVYVTHDQTEALAMSDRIAVMRAGRIDQIGAPAEIYSRPRTRFTATFVGATNLFEGAATDTGEFVSSGLLLRVPGAGVAASVRPERVVLGDAIGSADGWNVFDTQVEEVVFHGSNVHYRLRLPNGGELIAERPNDSGLGVAPGDRIQAGWPADSAVMLEA